MLPFGRKFGLGSQCDPLIFARGFHLGIARSGNVEALSDSRGTMVAVRETVPRRSAPYQGSVNQNSPDFPASRAHYPGGRNSLEATQLSTLAWTGIAGLSPSERPVLGRAAWLLLRKNLG